MCPSILVERGENALCSLFRDLNRLCSCNAFAFTLIPIKTFDSSLLMGREHGKGILRSLISISPIANTIDLKQIDLKVVTQDR